MPLPFQTSLVPSGVKSLTTYSECSTDKTDIEYKDGQIVSANLDTLIDMLRPGASKSFAFTFLLCSRLFIKPHELLSKLCKRYFKSYDKVVSMSFIFTPMQYIAWLCVLYVFFLTCFTKKANLYINFLFFLIG